VLDGDCRLATCCFLVIVVGRLGIRQRRHLTTSHGDGGARIEGRLLRKFVRALIERSLVEVAVSAQPCDCTTLRAPHDRVQLLACGRSGRVEDHARDRVADEDAIEKSDVEMNVQVQAAKSLHEVDRAALPILDSQALGVCAIPREDGIDCDATDRRQHLRLEGGQLAQFVGQGQDVLPHGHVGQNPVHDG